MAAAKRTFIPFFAFFVLLPLETYALEVIDMGEAGGERFSAVRYEPGPGGTVIGIRREREGAYEKLAELVVPASDNGTPGYRPTVSTTSWPAIPAMKRANCSSTSTT